MTQGIEVPATTLSKRRRSSWLPILVVAAVLGLIWIGNWAAVHRPIAAAWAEDHRNDGVAIWTHYSWWLKADTLVLDIREVRSTKSPADVMRMVFQAAKAMKDRTFTEVMLAYRGETRFVMRGQDFQTLGAQVSYGENPIYLLRTFPEKLVTVTGGQAFPTWEGGALGVASKQLEDLAEFQRQWYAADEVRRASN